MRRPHATALVVSVLLAVLLLWSQPAGAADDSSTTTAVPSGDIIPEPDSGTPPEDAGDRGGALQTALFVGIIVAVAGAGGWLIVQSRRTRAERGF